MKKTYFLSKQLDYSKIDTRAVLKTNKNCFQNKKDNQKSVEKEPSSEGKKTSQKKKYRNPYRKIRQRNHRLNKANFAQLLKSAECTDDMFWSSTSEDSSEQINFSSAIGIDKMILQNAEERKQSESYLQCLNKKKTRNETMEI